LLTCPSCKAALPQDNVSFCPHCGQRLGAAENPDFEITQPIPTAQMGKCLVSPKAKRPIGKLALMIILPLTLLLGAGFGWAYQNGYYLDEQSPQVAISGPATGKTIFLPASRQAEEIIQVAAQDNRRIKKVELYVNDALVHTFERSDFYIYHFGTRETGQYAFRAVAYDNRGNQGASTGVVSLAVVDAAVSSTPAGPAAPSANQLARFVIAKESFNTHIQALVHEINTLPGTGDRQAALTRIKASCAGLLADEKQIYQELSYLPAAGSLKKPKAQLQELISLEIARTRALIEGLSAAQNKLDNSPAYVSGGAAKAAYDQANKLFKAAYGAKL